MRMAVAQKGDNSILRAIFMLVFLAGLAGCGEDENRPPPTPAQSWNGMLVRIETHPNPPLQGKSGVMVVVTGERGRPVHDLIVSLRATDTAPWVQAVQDGHMGVYRRGINLGFGESTVLQVLLKRGKEQQVLLFPIKFAES